MLLIRSDDGSRTYRYVLYHLERANQGKIKQVMEDAHNLHIGKKFPIDEALLKLKFQFQLLLNLESQVILYYSVKA